MLTEPNISPRSIDIARRVFQEVASAAPAQTTRELIEGVVGHRVARIQVSECGLDAVDRLSRQLGFGASVADYKIVCSAKDQLDGWSDTVAETLPLTAPAGEFLVYVAATKDDAEHARVADSCGDSNTFGELAGIPACCRAFYLRDVEGAFESNPLDRVLTRSDARVPVPMGCNIGAQYINKGFLSHYPCKLTCHATGDLARYRFGLMLLVNQEFAEELQRGLAYSYLISRTGLSAFSSRPDAWPQARDLVVRLGNALDCERSTSEYRVSEDGCVEFYRGDEVIQKLAWPEAFLIRSSGRWR